MQPGRIERRSHDYYRHGTTTLFAALEIATGQVTAALKPRYRHQEFLAFLRQIDRAYADALDENGAPLELHLVMDNYAAHKHAKVKEFPSALQRSSSPSRNPCDSQPWARRSAAASATT